MTDWNKTKEELIAEVEALRAELNTLSALRKSKGETELRVAERTAELVNVNHRLELELEERKRVETALRVSQARFAGILEIADDAVISVDEQQRITLFNQGAEKIFGYSTSEVLGQSLNILLPLSAMTNHQQHVRSFDQSSGQARRMGDRRPIFGRRKDGSEFPAEASISRLRLGDEVIFTVILRDITERKQAEDALARLSRQNQLLLNAIGEGLCGIGVDDLISFANPAAARMLGYQVQDLTRQPIHLIFPFSRSDGLPYRFADSPIYTSLHEGAVQQVFHESLRRQDGSCFPVEYVSTPILEDGAIVGAVIAFKDITERQQVERMKDEFISVVSHELRTPLTSIHGSLGMLASGLLDPRSDRGRRLLQIAVDSTDRLVRLINDILDIERIESGKVTMAREDCRVPDLMHEAVNVVQAIAEKSGVTLTVSAPNVHLYADPDRIIQVLTNLLSNAIKFSPRGSTVWLSAEVVEPSPEATDAIQEASGVFCPFVPSSQIQFTVTDKGRGIPADKVHTIFERFQQVDASDSRNTDGTGLGLAICRSIVQQHRGRIWVDSELGIGSTFYFTLPMPQEVVSPTQWSVTGGPLVMVCDDDSNTLAVMRSLLEQHGYQVETVSSGQEAVDQAIARRPNAILLDLVMPQMNGWEVMAALKQRSDTCDIPILVCSVIAEAEAQPTRHDYVNWVGKPVDESFLFQSLRRALAVQSQTVRVLVIEDDIDLADVLTTLFQRHDIETFHAHTAREAIRLSQQVNPDLLVLDLTLPDGDGFSVVEWLRQHNRLYSVPLVVYSAKDLDESERNRLRLGQTEFLTKGRVSTQEFEHRVMELLHGITQTVS